MNLILALILSAAAAEDTQDFFNEGVKRLEAKDYATAAIAFEKSLAIKESAPALYNLAVAYRGAGRYRDAKLKLERFIAVIESAQAAEGAIGRARSMLDDVKKRISRVRIKVRGGASSVSIGAINLMPQEEQTIELDPGRYPVIAKRDGFAPARATVTAVEGELAEVSLDVSKNPLPGSVRANVSPDVAEIRVDGAVAGNGRVAQKLDPGPLTIEIAADGHEPQLQKVLVEPGRELELDVQLQEQSQPITGEWWFWAGIAAAVVAAGTATGFVVANRKADCDGGSLNKTLFCDE